MQTILWTVLGIAMGADLAFGGLRLIFMSGSDRPDYDTLAGYLLMGILFLGGGLWMFIHNLNEIQRWYDIARPVLGV